MLVSKYHFPKIGLPFSKFEFEMKQSVIHYEFQIQILKKLGLLYNYKVQFNFLNVYSRNLS